MNDHYFINSILLAIVVSQAVFLIVFFIAFMSYANRKKKSSIDIAEIVDVLHESETLRPYVVLINNEEVFTSITLSTAELYLQVNGRDSDISFIVNTLTGDYGYYEGKHLIHRHVK